MALTLESPTEARPVYSMRYPGGTAPLPPNDNFPYPHEGFTAAEPLINPNGWDFLLMAHL